MTLVSKFKYEKIKWWRRTNKCWLDKKIVITEYDNDSSAFNISSSKYKYFSRREWTNNTEVDTEEEMLTKLKNEQLVFDEEIHTDTKTIVIGKREINYSMTLSITIYNHMSGEEIHIEYEEGMTWREFVESSYNTVGILVSGDKVVYLNSGTRIKTDHWVGPDEKIKQTENYYLDFI